MSKAPEEATHYGPSTAQYRENWFKSVGAGWYIWLAGSGWNYCAGGLTPDRIETLTIVPQPKPWSGPEDGLPQIGSIVLARRSDTNKWHESEVLRHSTEYQRSCVCAFMEVKSNMMFWSSEYKAIKTPDQIAADTRETAIRELMDIAQVDCRVTAARLVDAGFKREVV